MYFTEKLRPFDKKAHDAIIWDDTRGVGSFIFRGATTGQNSAQMQHRAGLRRHFRRPVTGALMTSTFCDGPDLELPNSKSGHLGHTHTRLQLPINRT